MHFLKFKHKFGKEMQDLNLYLTLILDSAHAVVGLQKVIVHRGSMRGNLNLTLPEMLLVRKGADVRTEVDTIVFRPWSLYRKDLAGMEWSGVLFTISSRSGYMVLHQSSIKRS